MQTIDQRLKNFYNTQKLFAILTLIVAASLLTFGLIAPFSGEKIRFFRIIFYLYILVSSGTLYASYFGEKTLIKHFIYGSIVGAAIFALSFFTREIYNFDQLIISSLIAGTFTILIALSYSIRDLKMRIFAFNIKYQFIAIAFVIINFTMIDSGIICHVGGILFGFLIAPNSKIIKEMNTWLNKNKFHRPKMKAQPNERKKAPKSDDDYYKQKKNNQKEINQILDKISDKGYDKLTKEEKEKLFKHGQK